MQDWAALWLRFTTQCGKNIADPIDCAIDCVIWNLKNKKSLIYFKMGLFVSFVTFDWSKRRTGVIDHESGTILQELIQVNEMLYTFGYEGFDIDRYISRLLDVGVRTVVDVRQLPLSRKRGFSKRAFAESLEKAGIAYVHWPMLGCPKKVRDAYKVDRDWGAYVAAFITHLRAQDASIRELVKISRATNACLVCFEADFNFCHRTFVAREAHKKGAPTIAHIMEQTVAADSPLRVAA